MTDYGFRLQLLEESSQTFSPRFCSTLSRLIYAWGEATIVPGKTNNSVTEAYDQAPGLFEE